MTARNAYLLFTLVLCTVFLLPFALPVLLLRPFDSQGKIGFWYARMWGWALVRINPWWRVKVEGREHIQKGMGYVIVATHQDMLDIPLLYVLSGMPFRWVSKQEVAQWPIVGWVLWLQRGIFVKRGDPHSAKKMMEQGVIQLERGVSVAMFPEGTRSKTGRMGRFMPGAFLLAAKAEAPLLPVVIAGDFEPKTGKRPMKGVFHLKVLAPMSPEEQARLGLKGTIASLEDTMRAEHRAFVPQWYE